MPRASKPLTIDGETKLITEWARQIGVPSSVIRDRLEMGWEGKRLLDPPQMLERHGDTDGPEWRTRVGIISRCYNPNASSYANYGGRGIQVCDRWRFGEDGKSGYACFLEDMGRRPADKSSIDRINPNGDYTPLNSRWSDSKEQALNRRATIMVEFNGKTQCVTDWAREIGISQARLNWRLNNGWSKEDALTKLDRWQNPDKVYRGRDKPIEAFGRSLTATEWAKETGVHRSTISYRLKKGYSPERAVSGDKMSNSGQDKS